MKVRSTSKFDQQFYDIIQELIAAGYASIADRLIRQLDVVVERIRLAPLIYQVYSVGRLTNIKYRRINIERYALFYYVDNNSVLLTDIYNNRQDIAHLLR